MKTVIVFDKAGNVIATAPCSEEIKTARCLIADLPAGVVVDGIDLENLRKPVAIWHDEKKQKEREREELVESIVELVKSGAILRDVIGSMELSNSEKWSLEAEVKKYGI